MSELKIYTHSNIDSNGTEHISVQVKEPKLDASGLWEGGEVLFVSNDHKRQNAVIMCHTWRHGAPSGLRVVKVIKGEVLCEKEVLDYCKTWKEENENE